MTKIVLAHATDEEGLAERVAAPLLLVNYEVVHRGTVLAGDSYEETFRQHLNQRFPVVLCGTIKAIGTGWARRIVNAAQANGSRVFPIKLESLADLAGIVSDDVKAIDCSDSNFDRGIRQLIEVLQKLYPTVGQNPLPPPEELLAPESYLDKLTPETQYSVEAVVAFRERLRDEARTKYPDLLPHTTFLERIGVYRDGKLTLTGVILFVEYPTRFTTSAITKCSIYNGYTLSGMTASRKIDFDGPVQQQIDQAHNFVLTNIDKKEQRKPDRADLEVIYQYPVQCLRETIANALCHRDYAHISGGVQIRLFNDRIEIASPGRWFGKKLKKGREYSLRELKDVSQWRNPTLARIIYNIKLFEGRGEGIPTSVDECEQIGAPIPTVIEQSGYVTVTVFPKKDLSFDRLSPAEFERLCLWLVEREGYLRPEYFGEAGDDQGRGITAYRATESGEQLWYFQCKRYQTMTAATLIKEVEKYDGEVGIYSTKKPFGIVFVTNAALSGAAREKVQDFCRIHGYECAFWARTELDLRVKKHADIVAEFFNVTRQPLAREKVSIARLPTSSLDLFGRDLELQLLDEAWENPNINIISFVAWGGVGKSALINHWLKQRMARDNYRGAERVYGWSFYSQGTSERAASADLFIDQALRWFGDADPTQGSPWDKGERLANFIRQTRTLLILDGLEPLQHPPGPQEGRLKDAALQALLSELAVQQAGLCVISTRERLSDLVEFENGTVIQHELEYLTPQAGAQLLRAHHVKGDDDELEQAAMEYTGHALTLTLLGSYLADVYGGDIRRRNEIESLEEDVRHGRYAERVMHSYEQWLGEGVELAVLRLLGLFDRPADVGSIVALRAGPAIQGLTEAFQNLKEREWQQAVAKLRRIKLLGAAWANEPDTLDAHPLVREHFKQQLKRELPDAWREANNRLYEHLKLTAKELPDTVEEMSPLYAAVAHGCAAGRHQEALDKVYKQRIQRGAERFNWNKLGAFGGDLAALFGFFEIPWDQPVAGFTDADKGFVLNQAGIDLRALGRVQEAVQPTQAAMQARIASEDWENAAIVASNLSQLYLTIGDLPQALKLAEQSVELADRSGDEFQQLPARGATLADALHQAGRTEEAATEFREAEALHQQRQPAYPILYSVQGFWYCDLLLGRGQVGEVKERAGRTLEWAGQQRILPDIALDNLSLGRAWLLEAQQSGAGDTTQAAEVLQRAVDGLRQAGTMDYLPRGLLTRAELHRFTCDYERAERDLAEALRIATRGGMGLHLADCHLEFARLQLAQGNKDKAREHWNTAKEMIERMGYHRRDNEVTELAEQLL
jgi:tetratricopeptide (TPR) repeat protein